MAEMMTQGDYDDRRVKLAKAVLAEVFRALGEYHDHLVLVGGWVPGMLMRNAEQPHIGSLDVDIALDQHAITDDCYSRISKLLAGLGFAVDPKSPHRFWKDIEDGSGKFRAFIDLLAAEYGGRGRKHEHQHIQDLDARKARGCDLAIQHNVSVSVETRLPNGANAKVDLRVSSVAAFIVMKAFAVRGRRKDKDAYDIAYCLNSYPGGVEGVAKEFTGFVTHGLVVEALQILEEDFKTPEHVGPVSVADFREVAEPEERSVICRDASERVLELVQQLRNRAQ